MRLCSRCSPKTTILKYIIFFVSILKIAYYVTLDDPLLRGTTQFIHCLACCSTWSTEQKIILSTWKYPNRVTWRLSVSSKELKATLEMALNLTSDMAAIRSCCLDKQSFQQRSCWGSFLSNISLSVNKDISMNSKEWRTVPYDMNLTFVLGAVVVSCQPGI